MSPPKQAIDADSSANNSDDANSLYDSLYGSDDEAGSITDTLKSSWARERNRFVGGRRYHTTTDGRHAIIPNDEQQQDAEDLMHAVYTRCMSYAEPDYKDGDEPRKLYISPIAEKPHRVLDVGTGTGIWAIDFAEAHPSAEVVGFDQSPIQPVWVPPNVKFEIEDLEQDWTYTKESFDFVYARAMHAVVDDWPKLCKNAFKVLKPGGYFEVFSEVPRVCSDDDTVPKDWPFNIWLDDMEKGLNMVKKSLCIDKTLPKQMEEQGYTNIVQQKYKVPMGPWAKDPKLKQLGAMFLVNLLQGIEGWTLFLFTQLLGKEEEETQKFLDKVRKTLRNKKVHAYLEFVVVSGQKPMMSPRETTTA